MPDLSESLQGRDLGHLRIIADLWGVDLSAPDARVGLQRLSPLLLDRGLLGEVLQTLPEKSCPGGDPAQRWAHVMEFFVRRYGEVEKWAPGALRAALSERTASATESLVSWLDWPRVLIPHGPEEFAFIPDDAR
jgi:hypothetical protein